MGYILTKEFRHELYKKALEAYINPDLYQYGLCNAIEQAHHFFKHEHFVKKYDYWETRTWPGLSNHPECYPEIIKYKPEIRRMYWFPLEDNKTRIFILTQTIKETRP